MKNFGKDNASKLSSTTTTTTITTTTMSTTTTVPNSQIAKGTKVPSIGFFYAIKGIAR